MMAEDVPEGIPMKALPGPRQQAGSDGFYPEPNMFGVATVCLVPYNGILGLELRNSDLKLLGTQPHLAIQGSGADLLVGWTLTHVNGHPVVHPSDVPPLITSTTTARFQLQDAPTNLAEQQQCCLVM
eukprot:TRINITY_DN46635_c0_g1_i1.p1 TRINITY_DN46635_c0_g1~~TRINITY_DN46635_c0_g1_i1.p1  ORF type:complete len:140 (+),score=17.81 TRINITY_DN46635_c0_g1_i1:42-422(+)